jgi:diguanylate cyclase (GGDEF)-like protein
MSSQPIILIVDDTKSNMMILAACLKDDYQIKTAINGQECLNIAKKSPKPDLILLDIEMPGINGYEACEQLKKDSYTADIPIIFITAKHDVKDEEKCFILGAVDYISKPIRPTIVVARVKTHITIKKQKDKLEQMALFDQLTNLYNRHFLLNAAKQKVSSAIRHQFPISVMMLDIDFFKKINDEHGHPAGDSVLKEVAKIMKEEYRNEDVAARFGGEEFVIILYHCDLKSAVAKASQLRGKIEQLKPLGIPVTVSIGISQLENEEESFSDLLERSDKALYKAKEEGRNRVISL